MSHGAVCLSFVTRNVMCLLVSLGNGSLLNVAGVSTAYERVLHSAVVSIMIVSFEL